MADITKIMAKLDKIDVELDAVRAGVLQSSINGVTEVLSALGVGDQPAPDSIRKMLLGPVAVVKHGGKWVLLGPGGRVESDQVELVREVKNAVGTERNSVEVSAAAWDVISKLFPEA
jgi:hypothetical protein